jgi:hypothetical protein
VKVTIAVAVTMCVAAGTNQAAMISCHLKDERVERAIGAVTAELKGNEYCEFRRYHSIDDIDGDRKEDFLVTFNVENPSGGGNNVISFLLVFLTSRGNKPPLRLQVGERGTRYPDSISFDGKFIVLHFMQWVRGDALCCPSGSSVMRYAIRRDALVATAAPN